MLWTFNGLAHASHPDSKPQLREKISAFENYLLENGTFGDLLEENEG